MLVAASDSALSSVLSMRADADYQHGPVHSITISYTAVYDPVARVWPRTWRGCALKVQLPEFVAVVSEPWMSLCVEFLAASAAVGDAWYGAVIAPFQEQLVPEGRAVRMWTLPSWTEPEAAGVVGLAPAFLVGPRAFEAIGGMTALDRAPVHDVIRVEYPDGRIAAVVRIGRDHADFAARIDGAYEFFEPHLEPPARP